MRRSHSRADACLRSSGDPKTVHPSQAAAQRQAERLAKVWRTGATLHAYPCGKCGGWHVGKPRRRRNTAGGGWK
jgi:hypothetical protein